MNALHWLKLDSSDKFLNDYILAYFQWYPLCHLLKCQIYKCGKSSNLPNEGILPGEAVLRLQKALANSYTPEIMELLIKDTVRMSFFFFYTTYTHSSARIFQNWFYAYKVYSQILRIAKSPNFYWIPKRQILELLLIIIY